MKNNFYFHLPLADHTMIREYNTKYAFLESERIRYTYNYVRHSRLFHVLYLLIGRYYFHNLYDSLNYPHVSYDKTI